MASFFAIGGYAGFVWPAYGVSVIGIVAAIVLTVRAYSRVKAQLAALARDR